MQLLQQLIFVLLAGTAIFLFSRRINRIRRNILRGKDADFSDQRPRRWKNLFLLALGQKKMFRNPLVAVLHLFIYVGFIIINAEVLEIVLDGTTGRHRLFSPFFGAAYPWFIDCFEWLALAVLIACIVFLCRRNIIRLKRFRGTDLNGWPRTDANAILITEIVLMTLFLTMNAADTLLQLRHYGEYGERITGNFSVSMWLHPLLAGLSDTRLLITERVCWWLHITGILAFLNYLPYSKHLHILLAFPNAYYARLEPEGKLRNMPSVQNEVLYAMHPESAPTDAVAPDHFGARDATGLTWKNLLDAYSCTECGRCTAACPANLTGKKLSPRKIMMDTRDRLEEFGKNADRKAGSPEGNGKELLLGYITAEELRACTTCNACVEECPVSINPLEIIIELRRCLVMEDSSAPAEWNGMFSNVENNFAPWKFSPEDRDAWTRS